MNIKRCIISSWARSCLAVLSAPALCLILFSPSMATMYKYTLEPGLSVGLTYDDNIGLDHENTRSDWTTGITPSIGLGIASQRTKLNLRYAPTYMERRHGRDYFRHSLRLRAQHEFSRHLKVELRDDYLKRAYDTFDEAVPETLFFERDLYELNRAEIKMHYQFGPRDFLSTGYRHNFLRYPSSKRTWHGPFGQVTYWFDNKHGMDAGYTFTRYDFQDNQIGGRDEPIDAHNIRLGYLHRLSQRTQGSIHYALRIRDSNDPEEDYVVHQGTVGLDHDFSETLRLETHAGAFQQADSAGDDQSGLLYGAQLEKTLQRGDLSVRVERGWDEGYLDERRWGFTRYWTVGVGFSHRLTDELRFYSGLSFRENDRERAIRDDRVYRGRAGLRWDFHRWYALGLEYQYRKRESDDPIDEYDNNRVMLTLSWRRPFEWAR